MMPAYHGRSYMQDNNNNNFQYMQETLYLQGSNA